MQAKDKKKALIAMIREERDESVITFLYTFVKELKRLEAGDKK